MRIAVNALSATNLSGRLTVFGHLGYLARSTAPADRYIVLYHAGNDDICRDLGPNVEWLQCSRLTENWMLRAIWERFGLPGKLAELKADLFLTFSGVSPGALPIPQIVYAQNPWCLVRHLRRSPAEHLKAFLQRRAYKSTLKHADAMVFISEYMRDAYRQNAGFMERASWIAYHCIDAETHQAGALLRRSVSRKPYTVLTVSAMASHKGIETVIRAIALLRTEHGVPAELTLVGPWPNRKYEKEMRKLARDLRVEDAVLFRGYVSRDELQRSYAESRVYCIMSRCESFGIPGVEAQAFGMPVVASNCCALPEVYGDGGVYLEPDNTDRIAQTLAELLTCEDKWERLSRAAIANAAKYRWDLCSPHLLSAIDSVRAIRHETH